MTAFHVAIVVAGVLLMCGIVALYDLLADHYGWEEL